MPTQIQSEKQQILKNSKNFRKAKLSVVSHGGSILANIIFEYIDDEVYVEVLKSIELFLRILLKASQNEKNVITLTQNS